jgi:hypothetical protein
MKLATTIGDFLPWGVSPAEAVRLYEGTGFRHLDYSFYNVIKTGSPFLADRWLDAVDAAGREADIAWLKDNYPEASVIAISAKEGEGLEDLSQALIKGRASMRRPDIGYGGAAFQHAMGKISEFYIQYRAVVCCNDFDGNAYLLDMARKVQAEIKATAYLIPHLKLLAWEPEGDFARVDLIGTEREIEISHRFVRPCTDIAALLNASAACPADMLEKIVVNAVNTVSEKYQLELTVFKKEVLAMGS